ncbi:MAG: NAD(P)/FAD-dependent oxidoreductase [Myxococcaceae bacterium]|nr:MAG: NAD(P)/FAD-dependent oxidoreductase [Myxococcaceae bacterium]
MSDVHTGGTSPRRFRVAVIGAGVGGVVSAAEVRRAGHEVELYEAGSRVGGIWTQVNSTSTLQISSLLYRFHPSVSWSTRYPARDQVLAEIQRLWSAHGLEARTRFGTPVARLEALPGGRWRVNAREDYDAVICCVGQCHAPRLPTWEGLESFQGEHAHSSRLDTVRARDRRVVIVGGGASAVEAVEWALSGGAREVVMVARGDHWMVPRNAAVNIALSMLPALPAASLRSSLQRLIERGFYRDLGMLVPRFPLYGGQAPCCNNDFLQTLRGGRISYLQAEPLRWTPEGLEARLVRATHPRLTSCKAWQGLEAGAKLHLAADLVVLATGFHPPSYDFLVAPRRQGSALFLRGWIPGHPTLLFNNCGFEQGFGSAGSLHLAVFTKLLLMFLQAPETAPSREEMEAWVHDHGPEERLAFAIYGEHLAQTAAFLLQRRRWRHAGRLLREDVLGPLGTGAHELLRDALNRLASSANSITTTGGLNEGRHAIPADSHPLP